MKKLTAFLFLAAVPLLGQASAPAPSSDRPLAADSPMTTVQGNPFIAPAGWTVSVKGPATILASPEGDSWIALIDLDAKDAESAVSAAWVAYKPDMKWPLKVTADVADKDGWSKQRTYEYQTS